MVNPNPVGTVAVIYERLRCAEHPWWQPEDMEKGHIGLEVFKQSHVARYHARAPKCDECGRKPAEVRPIAMGGNGEPLILCLMCNRKMTDEAADGLQALFG